MQVASSLHPPSLFHLPSFLPPSDTFLLLLGSLPSFHKDSVTVFLGHTNCFCRPFVQVQRAINVYAVRAAGGAKSPKSQFIAILHTEYGSNFRELCSGNPKNAIIEYLDKLYVENERYV